MTDNKLEQIPLSILDLASIREGFNETDAFHNSKSLIQFAEKTGFHRYWVAEHHGIPGVASSATAVLIGFLASHTEKNSRWLWRYHASEPFTTCYRRAVRHANNDVSGTN